MTDVGMHEAKTQLSRLVERAVHGEDVVITRRGKPAVRLVPVDANVTDRVERARRLAGSMKTDGQLGAFTRALRDEWD